MHDVDADARPRRSDRWAGGSPASGRNVWVPLAALLVAAAYGLAGLIVAAVLGPIDFSDDVAKALIGATPAMATLGSVLAFVGTRRDGLRALGWVVLVLGAILVAVSVAVVAWVLLAFRTLD